MKKISTSFLLIFLLTFFLNSCGNQTLDIFKTYTASVSNDDMGINSDIDFWTGTYFEKNNMGEKNFVIWGNEYTGFYEKSIVDNYNSYTTDIYKDKNHVKIGVRADTDKIVYLNLQTSQFFDTELLLDDIDNSFENALLMSEKIAKEFLTDISSYEVIVDEPREDSGEIEGKAYSIKYYMVTYARRIESYLSSDYITIKITSKGHLASMYMGDIGAFDNFSFSVDEDTVNKSINDKMNNTFVSERYAVSIFEIRSQKIVLTPTKNICLYSNIEVETTDKNGNIFKSKIAVITVLK